MKAVVSFLTVTIFIAQVCFAAENAPQITETRQININLKAVVEKVSKENFLVRENAYRVYQAKENINVARGNLLPKLNIWKLIGGAVLGAFTFGAATIISSAQDIAPFLVPSNWFRLKEQKVLYRAHQEGYKSLWANEVMTAKSLYVHLLLDRNLLSQIKKGEKDLQRLKSIIKTKVVLGGENPNVVTDIEVRLLALQEDKRSLEVLIAQEESTLTYLMGLDAAYTINPEPVPMPDFASLKPLNYEDFEFRVLDVSPEIKQFQYFFKAADYVKKETSYSFLGGSSLSRGIGGGMFDHIPETSGFGFGNAPTQRIVKAEKQVLTIQKKGVEETIKRQLKLLVNNYNLDLEHYNNLGKRLTLTQSSMDRLYKKLKLGENIAVIELVEASRNNIQAETAFHAIQYRFLDNEDKLNRLLFLGDYNQKIATIQKLEEK